MSSTDYLEGVVLFLLPLLAAGLLTAAVLRRFGHLDGIERTMAGTLVGLGIYLLIHLAPLVLGVLSKGTVVAAAAVAAVAGVVLLRAPVRAGGTGEVREEGPASTRVDWALAGAVAIPVLIGALTTARYWSARMPDGLDVNTFHLPNVARWLQSGSLWQIDQFIPRQAHGYYPNTGDLLHVATILPWDNDFAYRVPTVLGLIWIPVCLFALARELGAPAAPALLFGAVVAASPSIAVTSIPSGLPDALVCVGLPAGGVFLLRHLRTGLRSDLLLGALGLGLAFGTKWYAVSSVGVIGALLVATYLWRGRREGRLGEAVRDSALLVAVVTAVGGIWLLRNLVEEGNPFFPVDLSPFGITIFGAPEDTIREQVGFSIAHYFTDPGVLFGDLVGEYVDGAGRGPIGLLAGFLLALGVLVARRRGGIDRRVLAVGGLGVVLFLVYTATPFTALGFEGNPNEANFNARYSLPALCCLAVVSAWACGRVPRPAAWVLQAAAGVLALSSLSVAFPGPSTKLLVAGSVAAAVALLIALALRLPSRPRTVLAGGSAAVLALLAVGGTAYGWRTQERYNAARFQTSGDATVAALDRAVNTAGRPEHVVIAGNWNGKGVSPVWAAYGARLTSHVEQLGTFQDGFLTNPGTLADFRRQLQAAKPDLLVVGRGLVPDAAKPSPEETWARSLGWRQLASSERLALYGPPR